MNTPIPRIPRKSLPLAALAGLLAMSGAAEASCPHLGGLVNCPAGIPDGTPSSFFNSDGGITWANGGISGPGACCTLFTPSTPAATSTLSTVSAFPVAHLTLPPTPAFGSFDTSIALRSPSGSALASISLPPSLNTMHAPENAEEQIGLTQGVRRPIDFSPDSLEEDDLDRRRYQVAKAIVDANRYTENVKEQIKRGLIQEEEIGLTQEERLRRTSQLEDDLLDRSWRELTEKAKMKIDTGVPAPFSLGVAFTLDNILTPPAPPQTTPGGWPYKDASGNIIHYGEASFPDGTSSYKDAYGNMIFSDGHWLLPDGRLPPYGRLPEDGPLPENSAPAAQSEKPAPADAGQAQGAAQSSRSGSEGLFFGHPSPPPGYSAPTPVTGTPPQTAERTVVEEKVLYEGATVTKYSDGSQKLTVKYDDKLYTREQRADVTYTRSEETNGKILSDSVSFPDGTLVTNNYENGTIVVTDASDNGPLPAPAAQPETPAPTSGFDPQPPPNYSAPTPVTDTDAQQADPLEVRQEIG